MGETQNQTQSPSQHAGYGRSGEPARAESSLGGTLGAGAGTAYRILRGKLGSNNRLLRGLQAGVSGFAGPLRNVLHALFLEVSGLFFLVISISAAMAFAREYKKYAMHEVGVGGLIVTAVVGGMFLYFGVSSFWRVRRK